MQEPLSLEATAERFVRPTLRSTFLDLCTLPVSRYLERFSFQSDLVKAMFATTDGFSGLCGGWDTPGTGLNFLAHNMCRLGGADGTWMVVTGGMGSVTQQLALRAAEAGARIETEARVSAILAQPSGGGGSPGAANSSGGAAVATGLRVASGAAGEREVRARAVLVNADPFRLQQLLPEGALPASLTQRLDGMRMGGMTMKVWLCHGSVICVV